MQTARRQISNQIDYNTNMVPLRLIALTGGNHSSLSLYLSVSPSACLPAACLSGLKV